MTHEDAPRIFLSYSLKDKSAARDLHRLLSDAGMEVWFDEVALVPGTSWDKEFHDAIANSSMIFVLIGEHPRSQWQMVELQAILERASSDNRLRVVPILLSKSDIENIPPTFRLIQSIDLRDVSDEDLQLRRIAAVLRARFESQEAGRRFRFG